MEFAHSKAVSGGGTHLRPNDSAGFADRDCLNDIVNFICSKIVRLFPVLLFSILITMLFGLLGWAKINYITQFVNIFFLQTIGVTIAYKGINWYVSAYFWAIILYYCVFRIFKPKYSYFITAILTYFGCVLNINFTNGSFGRETVLHLFGLGLWRAVFGIGTGIFIFAIYNRIKDVEPVKLPKNKEIINKIVISIIEILCFYFIVYNMIFNHIAYREKLIFIILFSIMFFLFLQKQGILSKLLNNKYLAYAGKYSYSIYVMQWVSFIMSGQIVKNINCSDGIGLLLFIVIPIITGIITYYLIEIPVGKKLKNYLNYYFNKNS